MTADNNLLGNIIFLNWESQKLSNRSYIYESVKDNRKFVLAQPSHTVFNINNGPRYELVICNVMSINIQDLNFTDVRSVVWWVTNIGLQLVNKKQMIWWNMWHEVNDMWENLNNTTIRKSTFLQSITNNEMIV